MQLPNALKQWIADNSAPSWINNSRDIYTKRLTFLYKKFMDGKNEYWARQIEELTGCSYDRSNLDPLG